MKLVIFDIDGTLADTKAVDDRCFTEAFWETFQIDLSAQNWAELKDVTDWGITEEVLLREWGRLPKAAEFEKMKAAFVGRLKAERAKDKHQFSEVKGARDFFTRLQGAASVGVGIATGAWRKSAEVKLEAIGLPTSGIPFANSDLHRSREDITLEAIAQCKAAFGEPTDRIVYFGDGEWDFKTCRNLDIDFIGIDSTGNGKLLDLGAKTVFQNYSKWEPILNVLLGK